MKFPGWNKVEAERRQEKPMILLTVKDSDGKVIRRIKGPVKKGFHRVAWDLRFPSTLAINKQPEKDAEEPAGVMAAPGEYNVTLSKQVDGITTELSEAMPFKVERMRKGALVGADPKETAAFWQQIAKLQGAATAASFTLNNALKKIDLMHVALARTTVAPGNLDNDLFQIKQSLLVLDRKLNGNRSKGQVGEKNNPTINYRIGIAASGTMTSTYGPTATHKRSLKIAETQLHEFKAALEKILNEQLPKLEKVLRESGAPWVNGQTIPEK